jgi:DNA (cytosine-5)-methyltransferase 1
MLDEANRFEMISLFSGGGIGDMGFKQAGYRLRIANEIIKSRAALVKLNFPEAITYDTDILKIKEEIVATWHKLSTAEPFLLFATPPCQGMSSNGAGTLLRHFREGKRAALDPRNRLVLPALWIAQQLKPRWVIFENVPNMLNTLIMDDDLILKNIMDIIKIKLGSDYIGCAKVCEFADYGLPQRRKRLITIYTRDDQAKKLVKKGYGLHPPVTHDKAGAHGKKKWICLKESLKEFPPLDAKNKITARDSKNPLHRVPVLDSRKYEWIRYTPPGKSAFDNQCINPACMYQKNPSHGTKVNSSGINQAKKDTPLFCIKCGCQLPRPNVVINGNPRIMSGYTSAYKRMEWDLPASTITRNFAFPCSDNKVHPSENRVLSIAEACKLQSISDFNYLWGPITVEGRTCKVAPDTLIRHVIGESVPPMITFRLAKYIQAMSQGEAQLIESFPIENAKTLNRNQRFLDQFNK